MKLTKLDRRIIKKVKELHVVRPRELAEMLADEEHTAKQIREAIRQLVYSDTLLIDLDWNLVVVK